MSIQKHFTSYSRSGFTHLGLQDSSRYFCWSTGSSSALKLIKEEKCMCKWDMNKVNNLHYCLSLSMHVCKCVLVCVRFACVGFQRGPTHAHSRIWNLSWRKKFVINLSASHKLITQIYLSIFVQMKSRFKVRCNWYSLGSASPSAGRAPNKQTRIVVGILACWISRPHQIDLHS